MIFQGLSGATANIDGTPRLVASLMYGSGMRLLECCRLRVKDLDFEQLQITVRDGKGQKDRVTVMPSKLKRTLTAHLEGVRKQHERSLRMGAGLVEPSVRFVEEDRNAASQWLWQWVFPATRTYVHAESREGRRHHLHETVAQRSNRRFEGGYFQTHVAFASSFICDTPPRGRLRHPCGTGAPRSQ